MRPTVYLETTIPSYLTAWPSRDVVRAAHQQLTREWWKRRRASFRLYTSTLVLDEVAVGDAVAARARLRVMQKMPLLEVNDAVAGLTGHLLKAGCIPAKAATDAAHLAVATVHGMDYLLTWNCRHINNAEILRTVAALCARHGYVLPMVCTPEELMG
jgi:predicted nucleic acid-binding protein